MPHYNPTYPLTSAFSTRTSLSRVNKGVFFSQADGYGGVVESSEQVAYFVGCFVCSFVCSLVRPSVVVASVYVGCNERLWLRYPGYVAPPTSGCSLPADVPLFPDDHGFVELLLLVLLLLLLLL